MKTGFRGTFVISWSQTEVDGSAAPPVNALVNGAAWSWQGNATRIDGAQHVLPLCNAVGDEALRRRAARTVRRLIGAAISPQIPAEDVDTQDPTVEAEFVVTDGHRSFPLTLLEVAGAPLPLIMFHDAIPPRDTELWIVAVNGIVDKAGRDMRLGAGKGVICFTAGTSIATPDGLRLVQDIGQGDLVLTRDNGPQPVVWAGARRMSGARLYAMPWLRPIRIRAGALGTDQPDGDLLVSPQHRMLISGPTAQSLFNTHEVLVRAQDLRNDHSIIVDHHLREVTYHHLMLEKHQVVMTNGLPSESFHPADADLAEMARDQLEALANVAPFAASAPERYGAYARRSLSPSEAAILMHAAKLRH